MPKDYGTLPAHEVRRRDRAVTDDAWIKEYLNKAPYGALATVDNGQPFINSNLFVYDEETHAVYIHTARVGRTQANIDALEQGVPACFSTFSMGRMLPADEALEFSVEYEGVTIFGTATKVSEPKLAEHALQLLLDKYAPHLRPGKDYRPITADELKRTAVFKVSVDEWSAKKKEVEDDFPGAFVFPIEG
ncbi:MAG: pyridoxamine 5'-phosphate oxidase family protein [Rhodothermaceae bacterium]|nr:pyridoxamine 5'-phosphate oxidase family protein [Rhodothermaceae bacterium]